MKAASIEEIFNTPGAYTQIYGNDQGDMMKKAAELIAVWQHRAQTAASIPLTFSRGETEIDASDVPISFDGRSALLSWSDVIEMSMLSLDLCGASYWGIGMRGNTPEQIAWFKPASITTTKSDMTGQMSGFARTIRTGQQPILYRYNEDTERAVSEDNGAIGWVWSLDPNKEQDSGDNYLFYQVALQGAVLLASPELLYQFYARGAINSYLVKSPTNPPQAERDRMKSIFRRIFGRGIKTAFNVDVINNQYEIEQISNEQELDYTNINLYLTRALAAVGQTPWGMLTGEVANRSVLDRLTQNNINTLNQELQRILHAINRHILEPIGYSVSSNPESMTANMEDERMRAGAYANYVQNGMSPEMAVFVLGITIPDDMAFTDTTQQPTAPIETAEDEPMDESENMRSIEIAKLRRFIGKGHHLKRPFRSDVLTPRQIEDIIHDETGERQTSDKPATAEMQAAFFKTLGQIETMAQTPQHAPPQVNVTIPERQTAVNVTLPEQPAPIVNVTPEIKAADVVVTIPEQNAPVAPVVNVNVEPTPVTIENEVNFPKSSREHTEVTRDNRGLIVRADTFTQYEDDDNG